MTDIVICIIPKINPDAPTVGPAVLKSHLEHEGFSCKVLDFNIDLFNFLKRKDLHNKYFFDDDFLFASTDQNLNNDFVEFYNKNQKIFNKWIKKLKQINPRYIGLSLLSRYSQSVAIKLSQLIRVHLPSTLIVWGGAQVSHYNTEIIKNAGLCDYYIHGDGELSIVELLKGNVGFPGINSVEPFQVQDLDLVMIPNYDDINWDEYFNMQDYNPVYITGSRGCVKKCTFCSVASIWPKYKFRSANNITEEIVTVKENYGRYTFKFTDSLINGSMKSFRQLLDNLIEYRKKDSNFVWSSQWIVRSKSQSSDSDYEKMKLSGCIELDVGIESFSQDIRYHMGKKFTDEDMWYCFDMLKKFKIPYTMLMITGYPTETQQDHHNTLSVIRKMFELGYAFDRETNKKLIHFSFTPMLLDGPIFDMVEKDLEYFNNERDWKYNDNDTETRIKRHTEIIQLIEFYQKEKSSWLQYKDLNSYKKEIK